jgi:hypothetical protein
MKLWSKLNLQRDTGLGQRPQKEDHCAPTVARYCSTGEQQISVGRNLKLIQGRSHPPQMVENEISDLLDRCQTFRTLDEHAELFLRSTMSRQYVPDPSLTTDIKEQLSELIARGLLISDEEVLASIAGQADSQRGGESIATVGIVTRDRLKSLTRCLVSFIENGKHFGRTNDFVIMDDSQASEAREGTREALRQIKNKYGVRISYSGLEEKQHFAQTLASNGALPPHVVDFALSNPERCERSTGANRNALFLHSVGDLIYSADDDTVSQVSQHPAENQEIAFGSSDDFLEYSFYSDHDASLRSARFVTQDILSLHEQLLGKSVSECAGEFGGVSAVNIDHVTPQFIQQLLSDKTKISMTLCGVIGDAGIASPLPYLVLRPEMRERLVQSESVYRSACTSREVKRLVNRSVVTNGLWGFQTLSAAFDNRDLLPPFFPVQYGQDSLFGVTLRECFKNDLIGHVPWAILHEPLELRSFPLRFAKEDATALPTVSIISACISFSQSFPKGIIEEQRLRLLGQHLMQLGKLPLSEFEDVLRAIVWKSQGDFAFRLESYLSLYKDSPTYWATDVRCFLDTLFEAMLKEEYIVPRELLGGRGLEEARTASRRLAYRFGELLYWWPEMIATSKDLRNKGTRLAIEL